MSESAKIPFIGNQKVAIALAIAIFALFCLWGYFRGKEDPEVQAILDRPAPAAPPSAYEILRQQKERMAYVQIEVVKCLRTNPPQNSEAIRLLRVRQLELDALIDEVPGNVNWTSSDKLSVLNAFNTERQGLETLVGTISELQRIR